MRQVFERFDPRAAPKRRSIRAAVVLAMLSACSGEGAGENASPRAAPPALGGGEIPSPTRNPMTAAGVALGERLFMDPILSGDDSRACASCHRPELAFSDGLARAEGLDGRPLPRHTPALINLAWRRGLFWDGGANDLESQAYAPLTSPLEMNQDLGELVAELSAHPEYPAMFAAAFEDGVTHVNVVRALAQYERSLVSANSRYDRWVTGEAEALDALERRGFAVFERLCARCHPAPLFTDERYHNNGLDSAFDDSDERVAWGRARISNAQADLGKFKTPSLRNVNRTAPYMHDGRFATLAEVLEHYRSGVRPSASVDRQLAGFEADGSGETRTGLDFDDAEAEALLAFLATLDDSGVPTP